jgi:hypothetical protein
VAAEDVVARLRVEGEGPFAQAFARARDAMRGTSTEAAQSERGMGAAARALAGAAGAAVVARRGYQGHKDAVNTTANLARETAAFSRASGLSARESQAWITVARSRGIQTRQLQIGMATFGRQLLTTGKQGEGTSKALQQLGVDQNALMRMPMQQRMGAVADAFARMPDGVEKAAAAQRLFGRSGQQLLPLLNAGAEGLQSQLDTANRLVPPLGKTAAESLKMAQKQREMQMALTGVKTTIGSALIPILSSLLSAFVPILSVIATALNKVPALSSVLVILGTALGTLMVLNKVNGLLRLFNVTLLSNPIMLVVTAIIALVAALVLAYQRVSWFRNAVDAAFGAVKTAVVSAANFVGGQIGRIVGFVTGLPRRVSAAARGAFNGIVNAAKDAAMWAWRQFVWLVDQIRKLPGTISRFIGSLGSSVGNALKSAVQAVLPGPLASLLATGGIIAAQTGVNMGRGKNVLVGERGPEVLSLPSGSRVTPLPPPSLAASQLAGGGGRPIVCQVFLDRRQIATAMASYAAEQQAAR